MRNDNSKILVEVGQIWKLGHSDKPYTITRIEKNLCYYEVNGKEKIFGETINGYAVSWVTAILVSNVMDLLYKCPICREKQCKSIDCG